MKNREKVLLQSLRRDKSRSGGDKREIVSMMKEYAYLVLEDALDGRCLDSAIVDNVRKKYKTLALDLGNIPKEL